MVNSAEFAKRLQKILKFYGVSATAFSEKINFNRSTISHLLSGRNKPSLEFVMKVLNQFPEVELYWLLNGTGNFPSTLSSEKTKIGPREFSPQSKASDVTPISELPTEALPERSKKIKIAKNTSEIDRIIIFFKDGSFKAYE